jgi:hypothetical protein
MKFTYDFIKENIRIYNEAKSKISIISDYESDKVTYSAMRSIGLGVFADFYSFFSKNKSDSFGQDDLIKAITWKELKPILIESTKSVRFKTWLQNRTEKKFCQMLNNADDFDRLLNGRWLTKPNYRRRGRRSNEHIEGLHVAFVPLLNYIISNNVEVCDMTIQHILSKLKWYTSIQLDLDSVPNREIDITTGVMNSIADTIISSGIDFRKLNIDFLVDTVSNNLRNLMSVPEETRLRSLIDLEKNGISYLTKGEYYTVTSSIISYGFVKVFLADNTGFRSYYEYKYFEDMQVHRDLLLKQMGL